MTEQQHRGSIIDDERPGCLGGIVRLLALTWIVDWLQDNFGFGRGCCGVPCGIVLVLLFIGFACSIIFGTNWLEFRF